MTEVEIEALRPFNRTPQGDLVHPGDPAFMVGEVRADELERNGLARKTGRTTKAKPAPANKMAPEPANKAEPKPITVTRRSTAKLSGGQG